MDHLPWHDELCRPRPTVPYLVKNEDDICNELEKFGTWPIFRDWDLEDGSTLSHAAERCQTWLFFGLIRILSGIADRPFDSKHFKAPLDSATNIGTSTLRVLLTSACRLLVEGDKLSGRGNLLVSEVVQALRTARPWLKRLARQFDHANDPCNPWNCELCLVSLSSLMLVDLFFETLSAIFETPPSDLISASTFYAPHYRTSSSLYEAFRIVGRCPSVLERIELSSLQAYRLLAIPVRTTYSHSACQGQSCSAFNISMATYVMQHSSLCTDQTCSVMRVDSSRMHELVRNDRVPLVYSTLTSNGELTVEIVDSASVNGYTAISHVWAGGLGNFRDNAIYSCQLYSLHRDIQTIRTTWRKQKKSSVYYWFDCLCVPVHDEDLRIKAINSMSLIFAAATNVLVLDPELQHLKGKALEPGEVDLALLCCPWMARCWTLQEGALSVDVRIKFADMIYSYATLDRKRSLCRETAIQALWTREVDQVERYPLSKYLTLRFRSDFISDVQPMSPLEKFMRAWNELRQRSSTKAKDIAAIFAAFIDCSAGEILQLQPNERMRALLKTQSVLPASLLFSPVDPSSDQWCPIFPVANSDAISLSFDMGVLAITDVYDFSITDLNGIHIIFSAQPILTSGEIIVSDMIESRAYHIDFHASKSKMPDIPEFNVVFLLQKPRIARDGRRYGRGLCATALGDDQKALQLRFLRTFAWEQIHHQQRQDDRQQSISTSASASASDPNLRGQSHSGRTRMLTVPEDRIFSVTSPILPTDISPQHPITLDMGLANSPSLHWSRLDFFPFMQSSINLARALNMYFPLALVFCALNCIAIVIFFLEAALSRGARASVIVALWGSLVICIRLALANLEYTLLHRLVNNQLQQIWARSFCTTERKDNKTSIAVLMPARGHQRLLLCLVYGCFLVAATTFLVKDIVAAYQCIFPKIYGVLGSILLGLISVLFVNICGETSTADRIIGLFFKSIFYEFMIRAAIVLASRIQFRQMYGSTTASSRARWLLTALMILGGAVLFILLLTFALTLTSPGGLDARLVLLFGFILLMISGSMFFGYRAARAHLAGSSPLEAFNLGLRLDLRALLRLNRIDDGTIRL